MGPQLTVDQRQLARRLSAKGLSFREISRWVGAQWGVVRSVMRGESNRPVRSDSWRPGPGRPTSADREEVAHRLRMKHARPDARCSVIRLHTPLEQRQPPGVRSLIA